MERELQSELKEKLVKKSYFIDVMISNAKMLSLTGANL